MKLLITRLSSYLGQQTMINKFIHQLVGCWLGNINQLFYVHHLGEGGLATKDFGFHI
ncbi:MAG: hypothetical protein L3J28_09660 [Candidatus Polarisedimenticolaceae bacterium]|nr:hypothetical protein [Candidatus Polarisedimenticolaceae bacterium]